MEFSKQFIEIMDALADRAGIIIDWGSKNVVPYVQDLGGRLVNYEIATSVAWVVLSLLPIIFTISGYKKIVKDDGADEFFIVAIFIGFFVSAIGIVVIGFQIFDIIEALTIPEKTIYDMMKTYIK